MAKKIFLRLIVFSLVISVLLLITGCTLWKVEFIGFEEVGPHASSLGLCRNLLPKKDDSFEFFLKEFETTDKNAFYFDENDFSAGAKELVLVYLKYTEQSYNDAKEYIFDNMVLSKDIFFKKGDYTFYANYTNERDNIKLNDMNLFIAFNDGTKTIVSFGSVLDGKYQEKNDLISTDFNEYLQLFSKYYDFTK